MLTNWYFCCCVSSPPHRTSAFLSIIETLENPDSNTELLLLALEELERADSWTCWYAIPHVLDVCHHAHVDDNLRGAVQRYLTDRVVELPSSLAERFNEAIELCLARRSPAKLLTMLSALAALTPRSDQNSSTLPYLDLHEFSVQNLILALLVDCLWPDTGALPELRSHLRSRRDEGALNEILDDARNGCFGRLAQLLSIRIIHRVFDEERELRSLVERIENSTKETLAFEPDLLAAIAEVRFSGKSADDMFDETIALNHLPNEGSILIPLDTLGLSGVPASQRRVLAIGLWQATLWDLAAKQDPERFGSLIADAWLIQDFKHDLGDKRILLSSHRSDKKTWIEELKKLYSIITLDEGFIPNLVPGRQYRYPSSLVLKLLSSPSLHINNQELPRSSSAKGWNRYPTAGHLITLLRLWSGGLSAVRLLQRLSEDHPAKAALAQLVVQSDDALELYYGHVRSGWFNTYDDLGKFQPKYKLPLPVTGFALFVHRQLQLAGRGEFHSIKPSLFVNLLDDYRISENYRRFILPPRLMHWISGACLGATPGQPPARWLDLIPEVNASFEYQHYRKNRWEPETSETAALVTRYISPEALDWNDITHLDWRKAKILGKNKEWKPAEWKVKVNRLLLSSPELRPTDWDPDWSEPQNLYAAPRMVRGLERLASLSRSENYDLRLLEQWKSEFIEGLNGLVRHVHLPRFARLRLIEFVDNSIIEDDPNVQELIGLTVLEHGSSYEFNALLSRLYLASSTPNHARQQVQVHLLPAILNQAYKRISQQQARLNPDDPVRSYYNHLASNILQSLVLHLVHKGVMSERFEWLARLRTWREQEHISLVNRHLRCLTKNVDIIGDQKYIANSDKEINSQLVRAICYDPNQISADIYFEDWEIPENVEVLFGKGSGAINNILRSDRKPLYVMAVVLGFKHNAAHSYPYRYQFDIGAWFKPSIGQLTECFAKGDRVALPLLPLNKDPKMMVVSTRHHIQPIEKRWQKGDLCRMELNRGKDDGLLKVRIAGIEETNLWSSLEPELWDPDFSRAHRKSHQSSSWSTSVIAQRSRSGCWRPVDRELLDWLSDWPGKEKTMLAAYVGPIELAGGQTGWRFSTDPGRNYVITPKQLPPEDSKTLSEELSGRKSGLLVAFEIDSERPGLRLAKIPSFSDDHGINSCYPQLQLPCDKRNLSWANLFAHDDVFIAERDDNWHWYLSLQSYSIPGFPTTLKVQWKNGKPPKNIQRVELNEPEWDPYTNTVKALWVLSYEVRPHNDDWPDFIQRWLNPQNGMLVTLQGIIKKVPKSGLLSCFTDENVFLQVSTESISMLPQSQEYFRRGRAAEISSVRDWEHGKVLLQGHNLKGLEALKDESQVRGIVTHVPRTGGTTLTCKVLWESNPQTPQELDVPGEQGDSLRPGMVVVASHDGSRQLLMLHNRSIHAVALWEIENSRGIHYLDTIHWQGQRKGLLEVSPGSLSWADSNSFGIKHLAEYDGQVFVGGVQHNGKIKVRCEKNRRVMISIEGGDIFGWDAAQQQDLSQTLMLSRVSVYLHESSVNPDYYWLSRNFHLEGVVQPTVEYQDQWRTLWKRYLKSPRELPAKINGQTVNLLGMHVPRGENNDWTKTVVLGQNEGAYLSDVDYGNEARVVIYQDASGQVFASFRKVTAFSPERYFREMIESEEFGDTVRLAKPLYYVGPEERPGEKGSTVRHYRFEWGWGLTLLVSENQLRFNGCPFPEGKLVLAYGDSIKSVMVLQDERLSKQNDIHGDDEEGVFEGCYQRLIFDIQEHSIEFSDAHILFKQSGKKIVQLLDVYQNGDTLHIGRVYGFNEGMRSSGADPERDIFEFKPHARLSSASLQRLSARWTPGQQSGKVHQVMARMDIAAYKASFGQDVVYDVVRLSFLPRDDGSELRNDELIFMRGERLIEPKYSNDIFLKLAPYGNLHPDDIGEDFHNSLLLPRRNFSQRKQLLYQVADDLRANSNHEFIYTPIVLVCLHEGNYGPIANMNHGLVRTQRALRSALNANAGLLFATATKDVPSNKKVRQRQLRKDDNRKLKVELQPGLFVYVPISNPPGYSKGEVVSIEQRHNGYRVYSVLPPHERYLSRSVRPAVALPLDSLFKPELGQNHLLSENETWMKGQFRFSLAGLPDVIATPGTYDINTGNWSAPIADDFIQLMRTPSPHFVIAGIDEQGRPRISTHQLSEWIPGRLDNDGDTAIGRAWQNSREIKKLDWLHITFGDESIASVRKRIECSTWSYHDRLVGYWKDIDDEIRSSRDRAAAMTTYTGPVYFQGENWRLRYVPDDFERIGFPVDELIRELRRDTGQNARRYPVAGVSKNGGLWIEMAPGHLVELPAAMLFVRHDQKNWSLVDYCWNLFAAGDSVEIKVSTGDIFAPDRLILTSWYHGPRGAFSNALSLLPILKDSKAGALILGAGKFCLTLPVQELPKDVETVALGADNQIVPVHDIILSSGNVVLLGIDEHGLLQCIGLPGIKPLPVEDDSFWDNDLLARDCRREESLEILIKVVGGALPVTVETFDQITGQLTFSRRLQSFRSNQQAGFVKAEVIGLLAGKTPRLLVRSGSVLLPVNIDRIVAGIPTEYKARQAAARVLVDNRISVWLSLSHAGKVLGSGLVRQNQDMAAEIKVRPISVVIGQKANGVLCEDVSCQRMYWLADNAIGWVRLTPQQIQDHIVQRHAVLLVRRDIRLGASDTISVVTTGRAQRESKANRVGRELSVLVIGELTEAQGQRRYLVESYSSKVLLLCDTTSELPIGKLEPVEVIRLTGGDIREIVTSPRGEQPRLIDLPGWMLGSWPQPPRQEWEQVLESIKSPVTPSDAMAKIERTPIPPEILRALIASAYTWSDRDRQTLEPQVKIALAWENRYLTATSDDEIEFVLGLMVIIILVRVSETLKGKQEELSKSYAEHAHSIFHQLVTRAKRSLHSELLSRAILSTSSIRHRNDQLGHRVQDLENILKEPLKTGQIEEIRGFTRAVAARQARDFQTLALAISSAIGDQQHIEDVIEEAPICCELIELNHRLTAATSRLDKQTCEALECILKRMLQNDIDIVLLDPITL